MDVASNKKIADLMNRYIESMKGEDASQNRIYVGNLDQIAEEDEEEESKGRSFINNQVVSSVPKDTKRQLAVTADDTAYDVVDQSLKSSNGGSPRWCKNSNLSDEQKKECFV